ncbi:DUF4190 domain-containing protein [Paenibacillus camelliae]|uniref:DUF4190 domain-containing protein n=1 Tax=Paenibacillus camelliae TaxID=512410 RepID=UPI0020414A92|nr:DUF4190 domain-containing protein [Paenibacillus camelliae]MCM3633785.1 DUF4190 domain-containing protein [Paenibacillus camelliae]
MSEQSNNGGPFDDQANPSQPNSTAGESNQQQAGQEQQPRYEQDPNQQQYNQPGQTPQGAQNPYSYQQGQQPQGGFQQGQQVNYDQAPYGQGGYTQQQQQQHYQQAPYGQQQGQYNQGQYQYPPQQPGGYPYQQPVYMAKKTNTKSIVSLILGIASIMLPYIGFFIGIAGIIVSTLSLKELKQRPEDGKGLAISGLVTSIIGTVLYGIILLIVVFAIALFSESNNYYY